MAKGCTTHVIIIDLAINLDRLCLPVHTGVIKLESKLIMTEDHSMLNEDEVYPLACSLNWLYN